MKRKTLFFLALFVSLSTVYSSITYFATCKPPAQEYIAWGIFSQNGSLSNYFSGGGANITLGRTFNWHFNVTNMMGSIQYVQVIYRLANDTSASPNATIPANVLQIGNDSIFIPNGQTGFLAFTWVLNSRSIVNGMEFVNLTINGQKVTPAIGAVGGHFRFFFELWTYDTGSGSFLYGYEVQNARIGAPLQLWFNVPQ